MSHRTLDGYVMREVAPPFVAGLALFFVTATFVQVLKLSDAVGGLALDIGEVGALLIFGLPPLLGLLLPISGLYACLLGIGRLSGERELLALQQMGHAPQTLLRVPVALGACLALVSALALLIGEPWGMRHVRARLTQSAQRAFVAALTPQQLHALTPELTLWAEGQTPAGLQRVIVADHRDAERPWLISAATGALHSGERPGELRLTLTCGEALLRGAGREDFLVRFERGTWRVDVGNLALHRLRHLGDVQELTPQQLWAQAQSPELGADARAQRRIVLHRKLSIPIAAILFCALAVPLALTGTGGARARGLLLSTGIVVAYYYLGRVAELWARAGRMPPVLSAWLPNLVGACALLLLWRRMPRVRP